MRHRQTIAVPWFLQSGWRLFVTLFVTLALPTSILVGLVAINAGNELRELAERQITLAASLVAEAVDQEFLGLKRYVESFAGRPELVGAMSQRDGESIGRHLEEMVMQNRKVSRAVIADLGGVLRYDYPQDPEASGRDFSGDEWYAAATRSAGAYVSGFYRRRGAGSAGSVAGGADSGRQYVVTIASRIVDEQQQTIGYLGAQYRLEELTAWLGEVKPTPLGSVALVDRQGRMAAAEGAGELRRMDPSLVDAISQGQRGSVRWDDPDTGSEGVVGYAGSNATGWTVIAEQPVREASEALGRLLRAMLVFFVVCFCAMGALGYTWYRTLRRYEDRRRRAQEALARSADELEGRVVERTAELAQAKEVAQESEERLTLAMSAARLGHWQWDLGSDVMFFSERAREILGLRSGQPIAFAAFLQAVHPEDREVVQREMSMSVEERKECAIEYRMARTDGMERWAAALGHAFYSGAGEPMRMVGVVADVTDRKRAEQERIRLLAREREARGEAERVSRMKDEFLATVSHELRTPLNAILGWAQLLVSGKMEGAELSQGLRVIERNARVQVQMIEDLLDMSRIITGKIRLEVRRMDLGPVIEAALESVRPAAEAKRIELRTVLKEKAGHIRGDAGRMQQVIWNLVSNAIKFTAAGGRVEVGLRRVDEQVEIRVSDTGKGIEPDFLEHVFERFQQADGSSARQHGGLGLGLAIVKHLVELHGGSVRVESEGEGKGSTFLVTLPASDGNEQEDGGAVDAAWEQGAGAFEARLRGVRVLVVDDEPEARDLAKLMLEEHEAEVITAADTREAMDVLREWRPDVLISDIGMPVEDGYELIRRVRALGPEEGGQTPAAAMTAFARPEDRQRALASGYQAHLPKPVEPGRLVSSVAELAGVKL